MVWFVCSAHIDVPSVLTCLNGSAPLLLLLLPQAKEKWPVVKEHVQRAYKTAEPHIKGWGEQEGEGG